MITALVLLLLCTACRRPDDTAQETGTAKTAETAGSSETASGASGETTDTSSQSSGNEGNDQSAADASDPAENTLNETEPHRMGNIAAETIAGGESVSDGSNIYHIDHENAAICCRDSKGHASTVLTLDCSYIKYLSLYDSYLYFMTGDADPFSLEPQKNLRIEKWKTGSDSAVVSLVADNVVDYGTGFYICDDVLYYNTAAEDDGGHIVTSIVKVDVKSGDLLDQEDNSRLIAVSENAVYKVDESNRAVCEYVRGGQRRSYDFGCFGFRDYWFEKNEINLPRTTDGRWGFTAHGENKYVCTDCSPYCEGALMKISCRSVQKR